MWSKKLQHGYLYYLKTAGTCAVFMGGGWIFYQLRQISHKIGSAVAPNILQLEQSQAQYIYLDDPQLADIIFQNNIDLQYFIKKNRESIFNKITARWKSLLLNHSYMSLQFARYGSTKAIYSLGLTKNFKDWHYRQIAQMLDAKTAVALARIPNVDLRFFLKPPYSHEKVDLRAVIDELQHLLHKCNSSCNEKHLCLSQFLSKNFNSPHYDSWIFEHDLLSIGLTSSPRIVYDEDLCQNCVFAIYHHSSLENYSKDMIKAGGLPILMKVQNMFGENLNICILLAKILSNVSLNSDCIEDIYQSGWIGVLAKWAQHKDVRLSVTAGQALANLDSSNEKNYKYFQHVYLLHPLHRMHNEQKLDVIFIHGLLGGVFVTWRQREKDSVAHKLIDSERRKEEQKIVSVIEENPNNFIKDLAQDLKKRDLNKIEKDFEVVLHDYPEYTNNDDCNFLSCMEDDPYSLINWDDEQTQCWPKDWLSADIPNVRVIGIDYVSNLSMWTPFCPIESSRRTIKDRSDELIYKLVEAGVGKRPIVWICHSMGGLLVKNILIEEWKNNDQNGLCQNTRGIVFYSTPHKGSSVADLAPATKMLLWPSTEVQELRENSPQLLKMHTNFLELLKKFHIDVVTFSETKPTVIRALKYNFVTTESADPGVGEFYAIPQDHLTICKPANRHSFLYQKVLSMLRHYLAVS